MEHVNGFIFKRKGIYYTAVSDPSAKGGYKRESTGSSKSRYADKLLEQKLEILRAREHGWDNTNAPYIDHFKSFLKLHREGSETHKTYKGVLKLFTEFLQDKYAGIQFLHEFCANPKIFDDYKRWLKETKKTPGGTTHKDGTLKGHLKVLKTVFRQAEKWRHIIKAPDINSFVPVLDAKPIVTLAKEEDFILFMSRCKKLIPRYYPHYFITARCGLRFGEMVSLLWEDIDFKIGNLKVSKHQDFTPKGRSKRTGLPKERNLPLSADVIKVLKSIEHSKRYHNVFLKNGEPISRADKSFRRWIIAIVRGTRLEGMTRFHELRHTAGHLIFEKSGGNLYVVKEFLGHSDLKTTERYAGKPTQLVSDAVNRLEGFGTGKCKKQSV